MMTEPIDTKAEQYAEQTGSGRAANAIVHRIESEAQLPPLYATWLKAILEGPIPNERHATCQDCAMCSTTRSGTTYNQRIFKPDVKCCSFHPTLPNFLVGSILLDGSADESVASVVKLIDLGVGVTPLGLAMPGDYRLLYAHSKSNLFGRSKAMRCPHFIEGSGQCGIYKYRNAVCSTFHCKHVRGAVGQRFWKQLRGLLSAAENGLAAWCLDVAGVEPDVIARLLEYRKGSQDKVSAEELDRVVGREQRRRLWGDRWYGRERELYVQASKAVERLSWTEVRAICGIEVALQDSLLRLSHAALSRRVLPERLKFQATIRPHGDLFMRLAGYSDDDQVVIPKRVVELLMLFDGSRSTEEVQAGFDADVRGVGPDFLQTLVDFEILVIPK